MTRTGNIRRQIFGLAFILWAGLCLAQPATPQTLTGDQEWQKEHDDYFRDLPGMMQAWRDAKDPAVKDAAAAKMRSGIRYASHSDSDEVQVNSALEEIVAGGPVAEKEVRISQPAKEIRLQPKPLCVFTEIADPVADRGAAWDARRVTKDALEVWSEKDGWLFDGKGKLLNHAAVPRRDGTGLEWFGAFLPDGEWITTDLWHYDKTIFLYSKDGTFLKDLAMEDLAHPDIGEGLVGWARSDKDGKGWVFAVMGNHEPKAVYWTGPELKPRELHGIEPWTNCLPRRLGVRYWDIPSDDEELMLRGCEASHGPQIGYPLYTLGKPGVGVPLPESEGGGKRDGLFFIQMPGHAGDLGFWPGSHNVYIGGCKMRDAAGKKQLDSHRTWFLDEKGQCLGWLPGDRLADAADDQGMLFKMSGDLITNIGNNQKCREVRRYIGAGGRTAAAYALYDDLKMGLFVEDGKLELCGWE